MVKLHYHNTDITLHTITDMCQDFNKSRPYIKKTLDDIKEEYGEEMFDNHSCYSRLEEHLKRPALYVSDDIYNIIQQKVSYDRLKKKMINLLPDNTYELKYNAKISYAFIACQCCNINFTNNLSFIIYKHKLSF